MFPSLVPSLPPTPCPPSLDSFDARDWKKKVLHRRMVELLQVTGGMSQRGHWVSALTGVGAMEDMSGGHGECARGSMGVYWGLWGHDWDHGGQAGGMSGA